MLELQLPWVASRRCVDPTPSPWTRWGKGASLPLQPQPQMWSPQEPMWPLPLMRLTGHVLGVANRRNTHVCLVAVSDVTPIAWFTSKLIQLCLFCSECMAAWWRGSALMREVIVNGAGG